MKMNILIKTWNILIKAGSILIGAGWALAKCSLITFVVVCIILGTSEIILEMHDYVDDIIHRLKLTEEENTLEGMHAEKLKVAEKLRVSQEIKIAQETESQMLRDYSIKDEKLLVEKGEKVVLSKPIFGIFLGENISALRNRLDVSYLGASYNNSTKYYQVRSNKNTNVKALYVYVFKEYIYYIRIFFEDRSELNYNVIQEELTKKYSYRYTYRSRIPGNCFRGAAIIDEVEISISMLQGYMTSNEIILTYIHQPLVNTWLKEALKLKADKVSNDL